MRQQFKRTNGMSQIARGLIAVVVGLALAVPPHSALAQSQIAPAATGRFVDQVFRDETGEHKYVVFLPVGHRVEKPAPAILFLHGAGERGVENRMQLTLGLAPFVKARAKTFPFVVVFPQCESTDGRILESWQIGSSDGRRAVAILDHATKQFGIDPRRIALTGWSMGGYGAWSLAAAEPSRWSCVVPLSGGGDVEQMAALKDIPVWAFHGAKDPLIKVGESRKLTETLKAAGGTVSYTELPAGTHDINAAVYGNDAVMAWITHSMSGFTSVHHGHCHEVTIDSDTEAHGVIAMESWSRGPDRTTKLNRTRGHYVEKYRYEDGAWRIAETRVVPLFKGED